MNTTDITILAIDPGTAKWGWAYFVQGKYIVSGFCKTRTKDRRAGKLCSIHEEVSTLIRKYRPDAVVIETPTVYYNAVVALAECIGVIRLAAHTALPHDKLPVFDVAASSAKKAVLGEAKKGRMDKKKVQAAVCEITGKKLKEDEADAISIGLGFYVHNVFQES